MAFETYGFFSGGPLKILEDVGHILLGSLPIDLLWYAREHTTIKLPWPFKGQYPPGDPIFRFQKEYFPADRVCDSYRDELGRSIGAQLRPIWVVLIVVNW